MDARYCRLCVVSVVLNSTLSALMIGWPLRIMMDASARVG